MRNVWAIVLAAGAGRRFGACKQFAELAGRRLVEHAIGAVEPLCDGLVVVIPHGVTWAGRAPARVTVGGDTRSQSVRKGLAAVPRSAEIIAIHDAAHPLATRSLATAVIETVAGGADAAVPGIPVNEALRRVRADRVVGDVPRSDLVLVQMPQAFRADLLREAHTGRPEAVEDSWLIAELGAEVRVVPGEVTNIHVATSADLRMAAQLVGS